MQQVVASEGRMGPLALWVASFRIGAEVGEEVCPMLGSRCAAGGDVLDLSSASGCWAPVVDWQEQGRSDLRMGKCVP